MAVNVVDDGGEPPSRPQHTAVPLERSPQAWALPELMAVKVSFVGTSVSLLPPPQHTAVPFGRSPQEPSMALSVNGMRMGVAVGVGERHPTGVFVGVMVGISHIEGSTTQGCSCARALSEFGSMMSNRSAAARVVRE